MSTFRRLRRSIALAMLASTAVAITPSDAFSDLGASAGVSLSGTGSGNFSTHTWSSINPNAYIDIAIYMEHSSNGSVSASPGTYGSEWYGTYSVSCGRSYSDNPPYYIHPTGYYSASIDVWASSEHGSAYASDSRQTTCNF